VKTFELMLPPFHFSVSTDVPSVIEHAQRMYDKQYLPSGALPYIDYHLRVQYSGGIRKWFRPQVRFMADQQEPFKPLNASQAYAMLEWGMNWAVAAHEMQHLFIHSAVLAQGEHAVLFPAPPGSGKSTLTAHFSHHGWRLLSDEMALVTPDTLTVTPFCRPICLKNQAIELARSWFPQAPMTAVAKDTHKGDVVHLRAPLTEHDLFAQAQIKAVVLPRYNAANKHINIVRLNHAQAMHELADNAFNYSVMGKRGWQALLTIIERVPVFAIDYAQAQDVSDFLVQEVLNDVSSQSKSP
jgi:HprK-related kinase A